MDPTRLTLRRWRRALEIARILFEQEGYQLRYLDEIEEALTRRRIRPEQAAFWLQLKVRRTPLTPVDTEPYGVEFITTRRRLREVATRYPCPTATDVGAGVLGSAAALLFVDDEDGRAVAYAPPGLQLETAVHGESTHNDCDRFSPETIPSERWQIRGRELARALHRLAPLDDQDALLLLEGAIEEGWVTDTDVGLSSRARACAVRPEPQRQPPGKVDGASAVDAH